VAVSPMLLRLLQVVKRNKYLLPGPLMYLDRNVRVGLDRKGEERGYSFH
jgi:hypothetical protein